MLNTLSICVRINPCPWCSATGIDENKVSKTKLTWIKLFSAGNALLISMSDIYAASSHSNVPVPVA